MDALTHVLLPLTVVCAVRPDRFDSPTVFTLGGLGLVSDAVKFLGMPRLIHSLVTIVSLRGEILLTERLYRGKNAWSWVVVAIIASHLVMDFVDGGAVPLLYPFIGTGIGLQYPVQTQFGVGPLSVPFEGPVAGVRTVAPRPGLSRYGLVQAGGIVWMLAFAAAVVGRRQPGPSGDPA